MTQVPVSLQGDRYRAASYPRSYAGWFRGALDATFVLDADLAAPDANVLAMPNRPLTPLAEAPIIAGERFFGMGMNGDPFPSLAGVTAAWMRTHDTAGCPWRHIQPGVAGTRMVSKGQWTWTKADAFMDAYAVAGREICWTLFGTPAWASARPAEIGAYGVGWPGNSAEPADMGDWGEFCYRVAERYGARIQYFEIWNEPQDTGFFSGTKAKLAEMVRVAAQAVRAANPSAKIVSPAVTGWYGTTAGTYFAEMMAASDGAGGTMRDWIDIVAIHLYTLANNTRLIPGMIDAARAAMQAAGVSHLPLWDTESGPHNPHANAIPDSAEIEWMKRAYVVMVAKGVARSAYYTFNHTEMGIASNSVVKAERERFIAQMRTHGIEAASMLWDGRIAYRSAGETFIV